MLPATAGFFMLRHEIINFLAQWGNFDQESAQISANMLGIFSLGIVSIGLKEIFDRAFYAQKNSKFPALFSFTIMVINVTFCFTFINRFGVFTMAIGFPISTSVGVIGLVFVMNRRIPVLNGQMIWMASKALVATGAMVSVLYFCLPLIRDVVFPSEILTRLFVLITPAFIGAVVYFVCAYCLGISQVRDVANVICAKISRGGK